MKPRSAKRTALAFALFEPIFRFYGGPPSQVPPDASAYQEKGEPRCAGYEHLDDSLDPLGLPEGRDAEREDEGRAQRGEHRRGRHHADPNHYAQAPRTHPAPLRPATISSTA